MCFQKWIDCRAMWQGDDAINICGDYYLVAAGTGRELRILTPREMRIQKGDSLQLVTALGERLKDARAVDVERVGISCRQARKACCRKGRGHDFAQAETGVGRIILGLCHEHGG
ncbi:MAG: hypothetical protein MUC59_15785, partial [Saprospiraceae bacterium]|nr:hypothetical protein [Saprospiraceae bacterium]